MLCFLCKTILSQTQRHIIIATISPTSLQPLSLQNSWISLKYISTTSNLQPFSVSYLINTFGFSPEKAASASKYINFQTREKPDLIIEFFKKQGFSQTQISRLIKSCPSLLLYDPEKIFLPKIEFLKSKGVLCSDLPKIIASSPRVLTSSLQKNIIPSCDFFMSLFKSEDKFIKALKRFSGILVCNTNAVRNIEVLREVGVPKCNIVKLLQRHPRSLIMKHERYKEIVAEVKEVGFNALTMQFVMAVAVITCIGKATWARKADLYKWWGWSDDEILAAFGRFPGCMAFSEDKIGKIMDFFVNQMGCESFTIARFPVLMSFSLKKRIAPRASVVQVLLSKGLLKQLAIQQIFYTSEKVFLDKFILCHGNEADELLKLYQAKMNVEQKKLNCKYIIHKATRKADHYERWGWSGYEILASFRRYPQHMTSSEDKVEETMDFFVNQWGIESSVTQILLSKGLVEVRPFPRICYSSEEVLLDKFIVSHENEADQLLKQCQAKMNLTKNV